GGLCEEIEGSLAHGDLPTLRVALDSASIVQRIEGLKVKIQPYDAGQKALIAAAFEGPPLLANLLPSARPSYPRSAALLWTAAVSPPLLRPSIAAVRWRHHALDSPPPRYQPVTPPNDTLAVTSEKRWHPSADLRAATAAHKRAHRL